MASRSERKRENRVWNNPNPVTPIQKARAVVGNIVKAIHKGEFVRDVGIEATEVFKGGSLGQGTAIPHHYDIDLVLYSRDLKVKDFIEHDGDDADSGKAKVSDYLHSINEYLKVQLGGRYKYEESTTVAIKFKYTDPLHGTSLDVDLLLSPFFEEQHELFETLRRTNPPHRRLFSASASKWQKRFIQKQTNWVKEFCRRAKAWKNVAWQGIKDGRPKSYLMCLLVIVAYNRVPVAMKTGKMKSFAPRMTEEFKRLVKEIESSQDLDLSIPGSDTALQEVYKDLLDKPPRIIDPANPSNNLYKSGISKTEGRKWASFAIKVDSLNLNWSTIKIMRGK